MFMFNMFIFCYFTLMISATGVSNVLSFYTSFRRLCLCRCGISRRYINSVRTGRSVGSEIKSTYEMPWLASIHTGTGILRGTLISDRHVVTAANPLYRKSASELVVTLGSHLCKEGNHALNTSVEAILIHPGYSATLRNHDIAILKLRNQIKFNQYISPICMPIYDTGEVDQLAFTASWLKNKSASCLTRIATLPILPYENCHGNTFVNSSSVALSDKGCLGPLGVRSFLCENDIGGPVMTRWIQGSPFRLLGIITNASCEDDASLLFTRTVDNLLWIHENIRRDCQCF